MIRRAHGPVSLRRLAVAGALLCAAACSDETGPEDSGANLILSANLSGTRVTLLVVAVTAPDITTPITLNLPVTGGIASGTITVTAGSDRIVDVRAFDGVGVETHRGADTIVVNAGDNPPLDITLLPLAGDTPIVVTLAGLRVTVTPAPDTLVAGGLTHQLTAAITTTSGTPVTGSITWATLDPGIATVSNAGVVTGVSAGQAQIVASYGGVAGSATMVVLSRADIPPVLQRVGLNATFSSPLLAVSPPGDLTRLFIVEQTGRIRILQADTVLTAPFLNVQPIINCCGEEGLLGLAFHPQYATNGFFFIYYVDTSSDLRVVRYHVSADPNVADAASATPVLTQAHPGQGNHNGGMVAFGPDGQLYIGMGDGGGGGDPSGNGQRMSTRLGKLLRVNVDAAGYSIPAGNPFIGRTDTLPEIWSSGLRNPWRFSFDRTGGNVYIADVGQGQREEINVQPGGAAGGRNYGWVVMEGVNCYNAATCNQAGLTLPVLDYGHSGGACSVTGGYVYRGADVPMLTGRYFYADYCAGWVRSLVFAGGAATSPQDWPALAPGGTISAFGEDGRGEMYVIKHNAPSGVFRFVPSRR